MVPTEDYLLSASYQSNSVDVILPNLASQPLEQPEGLTLLSNSIGADSNVNYLGYSLIGVGVVLFVGAGGYWWFKRDAGGHQPTVLTIKTQTAISTSEKETTNQTPD